MRYLLDTNIVIFLTSGKGISHKVLNIIDDYSNRLYISSITIIEIIQLVRIGKIETDFKNTSELVDFLKDKYYIDVLHTKDEHLKTLDGLHTLPPHKDPFDHSIIAKAISEKLTLISSDNDFEYYTKQQLKFVHNER